MLGCTLAATLTGAGMTLGAAGSAYREGASFLWIFFGVTAGYLLFALVGPRMRVTRADSVGTIFGGRFGRGARLASAAIVLVYTITLVGYSIAGVARVVSYVVGSLGIQADLTILTIAITSVLALYTFVGGLFAVAWTDTVQVGLMTLGVVVIGPIIGLQEAGGVASVTQSLHAVGVDLWNPLAGITFVGAFTSFVLLFLSMSDPTSMQRALAGSSPRDVRNGFFIASFISLIWGGGVLIIAGTGRLLLPDLVEVYGTTEALLPVFFLKLLPVGLSGIGIAALLAALMSTIDSFLLVVSITFFHDILKPIRPSLIPPDRERGLIGVGVLVCATLSLLVALTVSQVFGAMLFVFSLIGAALFLPLIATLFWRRVTAVGIISGILVPAAYILFAFAMDYEGPGGHPVFLGIGLSWICIVFASRITGRRSGYVALREGP